MGADPLDEVKALGFKTVAMALKDDSVSINDPELMKEENGVEHISAVIYCERKTHKGIIIGKNGAMLKKVGATARPEIEELLDCKVFLQLWVKIKEDWRNNPAQIRNFGYSEEG